MSDAHAGGHREGTDEELRDVRNLEAIEVSVRTARWAATGVVVTGVVGVLGWFWITVRTQVQATTSFGFPLSESDDLGILRRIDLLATSLTLLVFSAGVIALGLLIRVGADHVVARAGGALPRPRPPAERF